MAISSFCPSTSAKANFSFSSSLLTLRSAASFFLSSEVMLAFFCFSVFNVTRQFRRNQCPGELTAVRIANVVGAVVFYFLEVFLKRKCSRNPSVGFSCLSCSRNSRIKFFMKTLSGGEAADCLFLIQATAICSLFGVSFRVLPLILIVKPLDSYWERICRCVLDFSKRVSCLGASRVFRSCFLQGIEWKLCRFSIVFYGNSA